MKADQALPVAEPLILKEKKPKEKKVTKLTVTQLAALDQAPEYMPQAAWEQAVCMSKLEHKFREKMLDRFSIEVPGMMPTEKRQLKNFYIMVGDLKSSLDILTYVFDNWWGVKARYRLPYEYPTPALFCWQRFSRQIHTEYFQKLHVTRELVYQSDLEDKPKEVMYDRDW